MLKHWLHVRAIRERVYLLQKNPFQFQCGEPVCFYTRIGNDLNLSRKEVRPDQNDQEGGDQKHSRTFHYVVLCLSAHGLEINAGFNHQSVSVGSEALRVNLWIEAIRICTVAIPVHEVPLHFHVPELG